VNRWQRLVERFTMWLAGPIYADEWGTEVITDMDAYREMVQEMLRPVDEPVEVCDITGCEFCLLESATDLTEGEYHAW
jgi:hypothetical protein